MNVLDTAPDCPEEHKPKILIVEDSDDIRQALEAALMHHGEYEAVFASTGAEALTIFVDSFRCCKNAGVIMDLVLPDINGLRLLSAMRELEKGSAKGCEPARFCLASGQSEVVEGTDLLSKVGVTLRLNKPYNISEFLEKLGPWMAAPAPDIYTLCSGSLSAVTYH